jgi:glyceraldehyde 3-phosphate dehydrogenase
MVLFKNQLLDKNVNEIINLHQYSGEFVGKPINVFSSVEIAKVILSLDLPPSKLDIGKLTRIPFGRRNMKMQDTLLDKLKRPSPLKRFNLKT